MMRVGIIGLGWDLGIPLALAMRDYAGHGIVCLAGRDEWSATMADTGPNRQPEREVRNMLGAWQLPITDRVQLFAEYCEIILVAAPDHLWSQLWAVGVHLNRSNPTPVVVVHPTLPGPVAVAAERLRPDGDVGYSPIWTQRATAIRDITASAHPVRVAGSERVHQAMVRMWKFLRNTVPVTRVPLALAGQLNEGPVDWPPVATERLGDPPAGVDNPPG